MAHSNLIYPTSTDCKEELYSPQSTSKVTHILWKNIINMQKKIGDISEDMVKVSSAVDTLVKKTDKMETQLERLIEGDLLLPMCVARSKDFDQIVGALKSLSASPSTKELAIKVASLEKAFSIFMSIGRWVLYLTAGTLTVLFITSIYEVITHAAY